MRGAGGGCDDFPLAACCWMSRTCQVSRPWCLGNWRGGPQTPWPLHLNQTVGSGTARTRSESPRLGRSTRGHCLCHAFCPLDLCPAGRKQCPRVPEARVPEVQRDRFKVHTSSPAHHLPPTLLGATRSKAEGERRRRRRKVGKGGSETKSVEFISLPPSPPSPIFPLVLVRRFLTRCEPVITKATDSSRYSPWSSPFEHQ